jgi:threonine aldolase
VETNQLFPIFPKPLIDKLLQSYDFYEWEKVSDKQAVRIITSWATPMEMAERFIEDLKR